VIDYVVSDGHGGSAAGELTITVNGVNDAPVAVAPPVYAIPANATLHADGVGLNPAGVLSPAFVHDPDVGDQLKVTAVNGSASGVGTLVRLSSGALLQMSTDGSFVYYPAPSAMPGTPDSFDYTAGDGHGGFVTQTVTIFLM
jgi:hypothetical protein